MNREDAKRLVQGFLGKQQVPDFGLEEPGKILPLRPMLEKLVKLSEMEFGLYAWSREPLEGKFDREQKLHYILEAGRCGRKEAALLKEEHKTGDPDLIARNMGLKVFTPDTPSGGGHVIFAQYVEPDEVTIFMDGVERAQRLIEDHSLGKLLENLDVKSLLLAHEIFHGVEYRKADSIYTRTEKVELWKRPFSNKSGLVCLGEIAGMEFAREMLGISFSPYVLDVLLMYGYQEDAATALYEEIMDMAQMAAE
ncbi:hypothetical protein [Lacrimispora brassicae]